MRTMQRWKKSILLAPASYTSIQGGNVNFVSLSNYQHAVVEVITGAIVGAGPALTLLQAKNVEGSGNKALGFTIVWQNRFLNSPDEIQDLWEKQTVVDTVTLLPNTGYRIEVDTDELDVTNDFDCIRPNITAPGTSLLYVVSVELHSPRYTGQGNKVQPTSRVN
jgi:hypothetical protein